MVEKPRHPDRGCMASTTRRFHPRRAIPNRLRGPAGAIARPLWRIIMRRILTTTLLAGLLGLAMVRPPVSTAQSGDPSPAPARVPDAQAGAEVQARGQIHEAYGEPTRTQAV